MRAWPLLLATLLAAGCFPSTRVLVIVQAEDGVLSDPRYARTHIVVRAPEACDDRAAGENVVEAALDQRLTANGEMRVLLMPCAGSASRRYEVIATAEYVQTPPTTPPTYLPFVRARALSGYVAHETRVLRLTLEASCSGRLDCRDDQTCRDGACVGATIELQDLLPFGRPVEDDARTAQDTGSTDASLDASITTTDAWSDPDAPAPSDAAVDPALDAWASLDAGTGVSFTAIERVTVGSSEATLHGGALCCSRDGSFMAAGEPTGTDLWLWDTTRGGRTISAPFASRALGCRPAASELLVGTVADISVRRSATGTDPWTDDTVSDSGAMTGDSLGAAVALSSTFGVVGAPSRARGAAVVLAADLRSITATLMSSDTGGVGDGFGSSVAISGDGQVIAVGAPREDGAAAGVGAPEDEGAPDAGVVFVFMGSSWGEEYRIKAPTVVSGAGFGTSVALDATGTWLAVGAAGGEGGSDRGAVYVYRRSADAWTFDTMLLAPVGGDGDRFGSSVSFSDDAALLAVGAPGEDSTPAGLSSTVDEAGTDSGAVYLFRRLAGWAAQFVKAPSPGPRFFGAAVAVAGDGRSVFVGAPSMFGSQPGAVYRLH